MKITRYGGGWFSYSNPDPEERDEQPPAIKHWRQKPPRKRPEENENSPGLSIEHKDRFAALRRTVDAITKEKS